MTLPRWISGLPFFAAVAMIGMAGVFIAADLRIASIVSP